MPPDPGTGHPVTVTHEVRPITDVHPDPRNARTHPTRNRRDIAASLTAFGQVRDIVIRPDGRIIAGNGLATEAARLGFTHLNCTVWDTDATTADRYGVGDNRTNETSQWVPDVLADLFREWDDDTLDLLTGTGWDEDEVTDLFRTLNPHTPTPAATPDPFMNDQWEPPTRDTPDDTNEHPHTTLILRGVNPTTRAAWLTHLDTHLGDDDAALTALLNPDPT